MRTEVGGGLIIQMRWVGFQHNFTAVDFFLYCALLCKHFGLCGDCHYTVYIWHLLQGGAAWGYTGIWEQHYGDSGDAG
jgi:hypothetical protein